MPLDAFSGPPPVHAPAAHSSEGAAQRGFAALVEAQDQEGDGDREAGRGRGAGIARGEDFPGLPVRGNVVAEQQAVLESVRAAKGLQGGEEGGEGAGGGVLGMLLERTSLGDKGHGKGKGKKGKGKGGAHVVTRDLLGGSGAPASNVWDPQGSRAQASAGRGGSTGPRGSWNNGGGSRLAAALGAINDAWSKD